MLSTIFVLVSAFVAASASPLELSRRQIDSPFRLCSSSGDVLTVNTLTYSPKPPKTGERLTVTVTGLTSEDVLPGAAIDVTAKLGGVTLLTEKIDICASATCPIPAGQNSLQINVDIPSGIPKFTYNIRAVAKNPNGKQITCVEGSVKVNREVPSNVWINPELDAPARWV
ncbi:Phosphatidylglycerol/phosphatidylinositol transfer protein [Quaeritorhiza haematococci]|nr:Phosphatidylglycerol/phosphatidylinositol transfer protein [Quaeritorhiza haematococci]